jgi:hypothetical protein
MESDNIWIYLVGVISAVGGSNLNVKWTSFVLGGRGMLYVSNFQVYMYLLVSAS